MNSGARQVRDDLLGPLLWDALRRLNRERGVKLDRRWQEVARHELLYASQEAASLRTSLLREEFTDVLLAVELTTLIDRLTGLRDAVRPDAQERST